MKIKAVSSATELLKDYEFKNLYEQSFPEEEKEPLDIICKGITSKQSMVFKIPDTGPLMGFINLHLLKSPASIFIVYLAIHPLYKGKGLGGILIEKAYQSIISNNIFNSKVPNKSSSSAEIIPLWAEIDSAKLAPNEQEYQTRLQRQNFFQKQNMLALEGINYVQPPINGQHKVPMTLVSRPRVENISEHVRALYLQKYHQVNGITLEELRECWQICGFKGEL